jgi:hypothetical protein
VVEGGEVSPACEFNFPSKAPANAAKRLCLPDEKGGPAERPAFRTGTVIANFSAAEAELGDSAHTLMNS